MKRKRIAAILCMAVLMTGCAGHMDQNAREEQEIATLDFDDLTQNQSPAQNENPVQSQENPESAAASRQQESDMTSGSQENTPAPESTSREAADNPQDTAETQDLYAQFLKIEVGAVVDEQYAQQGYNVCNLESGKAYTFAELGQYVNESYFDPEHSVKSSYDLAQYTYVQSADSDARNLLIKFSGLGIYAPDDDSFAVYVIAQKNGQLYLTAMYECWARSYTEAYKNGRLSSYGSGGAGVHYADEAVILSDGRQEYVCSTETLTGWWTSYVSEELYREVFGDGEDFLFSVIIYTVGDEKFYTYDMSECTQEQILLCETYINRCSDEIGISWVNDTAVEAAVKERCAQLNVSRDALNQQDKAEWTDI
ncbi:MAG: hypothetical protein K2P39_04940 [Lachnospiraceae bacterium]|nr:hypothetical protein [Lachnospiraceae bacterium]